MDNLNGQTERPTPDPECSICLNDLNNKCYTDSCVHLFCFNCLKQWSDSEPSCPLCRRAFKYINHSLDDPDGHALYTVPTRESSPRPIPRRGTLSVRPSSELFVDNSEEKVVAKNILTGPSKENRKPSIPQKKMKFKKVKKIEKTAEKIMGVTDGSGELIYLMKWEGISEPDLISAAEANLMCPQIVIKYYQDSITWNTEDGPSKISINPSVPQKNMKYKTSKKIDKIAEKIMKATYASGELLYSIKWEGISELDLISAAEANLICPQIVIKFYEERITWNS